VLIVLKHFNIRWALYLLTTVFFILFSYLSVAADWRITISNIMSMAVLFFVPLATVLYLPLFINKALVSNLISLLVGGITTLTFQFAGVGLSKVLGVG